MITPVLALFAPMIPTQEVVFKTEKGWVIRIDFDLPGTTSRPGTRFKPVGAVFAKETGIASLNLSDCEGSDVNTVFDRIFDRLKESLDGRADMVVEVDNPCNDEFVKVAHQKARAAKEHQPFVVKLNGQVVP